MINRYHARFFVQVGHSLCENHNFSLNHVIVRLTKIMYIADKHWAHF